MTYTLLPKMLHALKTYTLETIMKVLTFKVEHDHFSSRFRVPVKLQRIWHQQYINRLRISEEFSDGMPLADSILPCAPLNLVEIKDRANLIVWVEDRGRAHHRLGFYLPDAST